MCSYFQQFDCNIILFFERLSTLSGGWTLFFKAMEFFSFLGNKGGIWLLLVGVLLIQKRTRPWGLSVLFALGLGTLGGEVLIKSLVKRLRPFLALNLSISIPPPTGYSFPSGHTLSSFAAATALYRNQRGGGIAAYIIAVCIGVSRVALRVHYPTDVFAGMLLGVLFGVLGDLLKDPIWHWITQQKESSLH